MNPNLFEGTVVKYTPERKAEKDGQISVTHKWKIQSKMESELGGETEITITVKGSKNTMRLLLGREIDVHDKVTLTMYPGALQAKLPNLED